jgi:hypothetical protein
VRYFVCYFPHHLLFLGCHIPYFYVFGNPHTGPLPRLEKLLQE